MQLLNVYAIKIKIFANRWPMSFLFSGSRSITKKSSYVRNAMMLVSIDSL